GTKHLPGSCAKRSKRNSPAQPHASRGTAFPNLFESGMKMARSYGLTWESSLATFIRLQLEFGEEFHRPPPIQAILTDAAIPGNAKIGFLERSVTARDWWECSQNSAQRQSSAAA